MTRKLLLASLLFSLPPRAPPTRPTDLGKLYAEFWEENLKLNPVIATFAGDPRYNAELPNFLSEEFEEQDRAFHQKYLDRARASWAPTGLTGQDRLSYEIFTLNRESALEELKFPDRLLPIDQFYNIANSMAQLGSGTSAQPFVTVKDYDDWLARAARAPVIFEQAIVNMREGMKAGVVQPRVLMEKVLPQLDANVVGRRGEEHFLGSGREHAEGLQRRRSRAAHRGLPQPDRHAAQPGLPQAAHVHRRRIPAEDAATASAAVRCPTAPPGTRTTCATTPCAR